MKIKKAVITSAGKATRMRPISHILPKGLLPIFRTFEGKKYSVPVIDVIMQSLRAAGATDFCFIVRDKGHMFGDYLADKKIKYLQQNTPRGFGDAVLQAEKFTPKDPFFLHVDDDFMTGGYKEAAEVFDKTSADCILFLQKVQNPRIFGVVEADFYSNMSSHKVYKIKGIEEKPDVPKSNLAVCGVYLFSPRIFEKLKIVRTKTKKGTEFLLEDAIQMLIEEGTVYGIVLNKEEKWLVLGNPDNYYKTVRYSYEKL